MNKAHKSKFQIGVAVVATENDVMHIRQVKQKIQYFSFDNSALNFGKSTLI